MRVSILQNIGGTGYDNCFFGLVAGEHVSRHVGSVWGVFESIRVDLANDASADWAEDG